MFLMLLFIAAPLVGVFIQGLYVTQPVFETVERGAYYLIAVEPEASEVIAAFAGAETEPVSAPPPTESGPEPESEVITLKVLNGNGGSGQATAWRDRLEGFGFGVSGVADAAYFNFLTTVVTVRPGELEKGRAVIDALGFGEVQVGSVENGLDAVVIIGEDALARGASLGG